MLNLAHRPFRLQQGNLKLCHKAGGQGIRRRQRNLPRRLQTLRRLRRNPLTATIITVRARSAVSALTTIECVFVDRPGPKAVRGIECQQHATQRQQQNSSPLHCLLKSLGLQHEPCQMNVRLSPGGPSAIALLPTSAPARRWTIPMRHTRLGPVQKAPQKIALSFIFRRSIFL